MPTIHLRKKRYFSSVWSLLYICINTVTFFPFIPDHSPPDFYLQQRVMSNFTNVIPTFPVLVSIPWRHPGQKSITGPALHQIFMYFIFSERSPSLMDRSGTKQSCFRDTDRTESKSVSLTVLLSFIFSTGSGTFYDGVFTYAFQSIWIVLTGK